MLFSAHRIVKHSMGYRQLLQTQQYQIYTRYDVRMSLDRSPKELGIHNSDPSLDDLSGGLNNGVHFRQAVVRNGYLPERTVQTGIGDVAVKVPKVRDRSGDGVRFNSSLLPPYLKRARSIEELIPWLYLKGISTGDYQEALAALLGDQAKGLSANTVSRLKKRWEDEHAEWRQRNLTHQHYVYWWADGVYSNVRMDDRLCLLVIIGVTEQGCKELVAVEDGFRESADSWKTLLTGLRERGLTLAPKLAVGDGAMGLWAALSKIYPDTDH